MTWMRSRLAGGRVFHRPDDECRGRALSALRHRRQVCAHGYAVGVGLVYPVLGLQDVLVVAPAAEEAHFDVRAADAEGFLAVHGVPERGAGVLLGPYAGQSAGVFIAHVERAERQDSGHAPVHGSVDLGVTAVEIVLAVWTAGVVRIGAARHAELVRVVAAHVLHGHAVFQRLAAEAALNVIDAATGRRQTEQTAR